MSTTDALAICNEALIKLGERPIGSFEDSGSVPDALRQRWRSIFDTALESHPWRFNRQIAPLVLLNPSAAPAATGFALRYARPNLCLRVMVPYVSGMALTEWGEAGNEIYLDATTSETVELEYHTRVDEALFTPLFRSALIAEVAAEMALAVTGETGIADGMRKEATMRWAQARHKNATEAPAVPVRVSRLTRLRAR